MSIRIELPKGFRRDKVAEWLVPKFGHPCDEEGKETWFWSSGDYYETPSPHYPGIMDQHMTPEGIRIWNDGPEVTLTILKWGS
jgi:hypothetical protein